jgi:anaphase-promoting complex subunit 1
MLPLAPLTSLVDAVLAAMRDALPAEAAAMVVAGYHHSAAAVGTPAAHIVFCRALKFPCNCAGDSQDCAWSALCDAVLSLGGARGSASQPGAPSGDWEALLSTKLHAREAQRGAFKALGELPTPGAGRSCAQLVSATPRAELLPALEAVHALYEDARLDMLKWPMLQPLASLAAQLACLVGAPAYLDYYEREWPHLLPAGSRPRDCLEPGAVAAPPPDVLRALAAILLSGQVEPAPLPPLLAAGASCCAWSATVLRLYRALAAEGPTALPPLCASLGVGAAELARLPHGVAVPLYEVLAAVRPAPPPGWPAAAYVLVGRTDLAAQHGLPGSAPPPAPPHASPLPAVDIDEAGPADAAEAPVTAPEELDGMEEMAAFVGPLRFGRDARLVETRRLLCSAKAQPIRLGAAGEGETPEQVAALQGRLWAQAARTCALALGRGAYTLGTSRPLPTEVLPVPRLVLTGTLPAAHNATVALDLAAASAPADFLVWPDFHNGCAAGLRLVQREQAALTRNWVLYNRPAEASATHAGMLLAFGLAGHLAALGREDLYRYLTMEHPPTTAAVLLGLAASRRGSGNAIASRMLFMHVPARHQGSLAELELSPLVQAAAVAGVGLLYSGTGHRAIAEVLLGELSAAPPAGDAQPDAREGHALAAGLALGMVVLGHGRAAPLLADLALEARLGRLLSDTGAATRTSSVAGGAPAGHRGGGGGGGDAAATSRRAQCPASSSAAPTATPASPSLPP